MKLKQYSQIILTLGLALILAGCDTMVLMNPKGAIGHEQKSLIIIATLLMLIVVIPVIIMTFLFAWKYRASNKNAKYTPEWSHSTKLESVVWGIPCVIIAVLAVITYITSHSLDPRQPIVVEGIKPITIEVVSLDWKWLFIYPQLGIATVNEIAFPINTPIEFKVTSYTVMNSFFIPQLGSQIYAMAGMQNRVHLIANELGNYKGISSNYSGQGFSGMKFTAKASTQQDFDDWVKEVHRSSNKLTTWAQFENLAKPSENNPVEYYSNVKNGLYMDIINKFMGHHTSTEHNSSHSYSNASHIKG